MVSAETLSGEKNHNGKIVTLVHLIIVSSLIYFIDIYRYINKYKYQMEIPVRSAKWRGKTKT